MKRNVIILMIDGGRLDYALKSSSFSSLKQRSVFFSQPITYGPHTIAAMHAVFSGSYVLELVPTVIGLHIYLKRINSK